MAYITGVQTANGERRQAIRRAIVDQLEQKARCALTPSDSLWADSGHEIVQSKFSTRALVLNESGQKLWPAR